MRIVQMRVARRSVAHERGPTRRGKCLGSELRRARATRSRTHVRRAEGPSDTSRYAHQRARDHGRRPLRPSCIGRRGAVCDVAGCSAQSRLGACRGAARPSTATGRRPVGRVVRHERRRGHVRQLIGDLALGGELRSACERDERISAVLGGQAAPIAMRSAIPHCDASPAQRVDGSDRAARRVARSAARWPRCSARDAAVRCDVAGAARLDLPRIASESARDPAAGEHAVAGVQHGGLAGRGDGRLGEASRSRDRRRSSISARDRRAAVANLDRRRRASARGADSQRRSRIASSVRSARLARADADLAARRIDRGDVELVLRRQVAEAAVLADR